MKKLFFIPITVEYATPYLFNIWKKKYAHYFFIFLNLFLPVVFTIMQVAVPSHYLVTYKFIKFWCSLILATISFVLLWRWFTWDKLLRTGVALFFISQYIIIGFNISFLIIARIIHLSDDMLSLLITGCSHIVLIMIAFSMIPDLKKKIWYSFRARDMRYLWVRWWTLLPALLVLIMFFDFIQSTIATDSSDNQRFITNNLHSGAWWVIAWILFLTLFLAPVAEELVYRHATIQLCGSPLGGMLVSTFMFAFIHISNSADWEHLIGYLGGACVLVMVFYLFNYNVVFSIATHILLNIVALLYI